MDPNDLLQAILYLAMIIIAVGIIWMMLPWLTTVIPGLDDMIPTVAIPGLG